MPITLDEDDIKDEITEITSNYKTGFTIRCAVISVLVDGVEVARAASKNGLSVTTLRKWCKTIRNAYNNKDEV